MSGLQLLREQIRYHELDGPQPDRDELAHLYSGLLEQPGTGYAAFVQLEYFRRCAGRIDRMQDIPERYFAQPRGAPKLFVSHKWRGAHHPDPDGRTLARLLELAKPSPPETGVWLDYCSLPQRRADGVDDRSAEDLSLFRLALPLIPLVILESQALFLWGQDGASSGWCNLELLISEALRNHMNRFIYERRAQLENPPLFAYRVGQELVVDSHLAAFPCQMIERAFYDPVARDCHLRLIQTLNQLATGGAPTSYSDVLRSVKPAHLGRLIESQNLRFGVASDRDYVPRMLNRLYEHLSTNPFASFRWGGKRDLMSMWHYVRGALGGGLLPATSYAF